MFNYKRIAIVTLLVFGSAGFSFLDEFKINNGLSKVEAARRSNRNNSNKSSNKTSNKSKKADSKSKSEEKEESTNNELLMDNEKSRDYMPEIFRCPDCGYEQDEAGFCPDHTTLELVKIISDIKNPLAPSELDGNEDILVDVPLNIDFKKDDLEKKVDDSTKKDNTDSSKNTKEQSSKKSKKSK